MKIKFINHSSIIIEINNEKTLCDPWYKGNAFANGWRLCHDEAIDINELNFDRIWISHEHPDHFSIQTLKSLKIKKPVYYQQTKDRKVKDYLEAQGFPVFELLHNRTLIENGYKITSIVTEDYDSCILFDDGKFKFLNVNDSQLDKETEIKKIIEHTPINLISIQFHYANWAGNIGDNKIPKFKKAQVLNRIKKICKLCGTKDVILFASFIYYAHEENFYWNKSFNDVFRTIDELKNYGLNPIIMKPYQEIILDSSNNFKKESDKNHEAIKFWNDKYLKIEVKEFSKNCELEQIKKSYEDYIDKLFIKNNLNKFSQKFLKDFRLNVKIVDLNIIVSLGLYEKIFETKKKSHEMNYDVSLSSEALSILFNNNYSLGSITISSRIQFNYENAYKFYFFFLISYRNNIGIYLKNSIPEDLNFKAFKNNGVLNPIFNFNKKAEKNFDNFNSLLENI